MEKRLHAFDLGYLLVYVFDEHVGHRAVGRGERHADVGDAVGRVVDLVDQSQIVDVHRDFGIVYVLERKDDLLLDLQYLFGCHRDIEIKR